MATQTGYRDASAIISDDGLYRYGLWRRWGAGRSRPCVFVMLNPSTADAMTDDPTIRRCVGFAKSWGFGELIVINLFAFRATSPSDLKAAACPVGPENHQHFDAVTRIAGEIVCAWGNHGAYLGQDQIALHWLAGRHLSALRVSKDGHPGHPLYLPASSRRVPFGAREGVFA